MALSYSANDVNESYASPLAEFEGWLRQSGARTPRIEVVTSAKHGRSAYSKAGAASGELLASVPLRCCITPGMGLVRGPCAGAVGIAHRT